MRNLAKAIALVAFGSALTFVAIVTIYDAVDRYETGAMTNDKRD